MRTLFDNFLETTVDVKILKSKYIILQHVNIVNV